jgi:hypothetical protein
MAKPGRARPNVVALTVLAVWVIFLGAGILYGPVRLIGG